MWDSGFRGLFRDLGVFYIGLFQVHDSMTTNMLRLKGERLVQLESVRTPRNHTEITGCLLEIWGFP